jgi:hypothetical protein
MSRGPPRVPAARSAARPRSLRDQPRARAEPTATGRQGMPHAATTAPGPQHLRALARANEVRLARADLKRRVLDQEVSVAEIVLDPPPAAENMTRGRPAHEPEAMGTHPLPEVPRRDPDVRGQDRGRHDRAPAPGGRRVPRRHRLPRAPHRRRAPARAGRSPSPGPPSARAAHSRRGAAGPPDAAAISRTWPSGSRT